MKIFSKIDFLFCAQVSFNQSIFITNLNKYSNNSLCTFSMIQVPLCWNILPNVYTPTNSKCHQKYRFVRLSQVEVFVRRVWTMQPRLHWSVILAHNQVVCLKNQIHQTSLLCHIKGPGVIVVEGPNPRCWPKNIPTKFQ
jgi:hypothetical protein